MAPLPIPRVLSDLDADWFATLFETTIISVVDGGPTAGIPVTSRVARFELTADPPGSAPRSVVAKITNPKWQAGVELYKREVSFYRDFVGDSELPIPMCFFADIDPVSGAFVLILEDLSDIRPGHRLDGMTVPEAEAVVDGLAKIHRRFWQDESVQQLPLRSHTRSRISKSVECLGNRLSAIRKSGRYPISDALQQVIPKLSEVYPTGMSRLSRTPQTLIHADLHVENFFLEAIPDGFRLIVIDWQNPCYGNVAFDVGHVLSSLRPELHGDIDFEIVERYHDRLAISPVDLDELWGDVCAALRHQFIGSANWFATFEAESFRDSKTMKSHWTRLVASLIAIEKFHG